LTYVLVNHLTIGFVIWFARGQNFIESGVFDFLPVMIDITLVGLGTVSAYMYESVPLTIPVLLVPLYLIQHTLRVPALERGIEQDPKTKLFNSEYITKSIEKEIERASRFDRPMTVVIGDMDLLREINNNYGHVAGDEALLTVANILKKTVRETDVVARYGGEEFVILMPETTPEKAFPRIESIRKQIMQTKIEITKNGNPISVTISFGLAGLTRPNQPMEEILHDADLALYHAKLKGRNKSFIYSDESFEQFYATRDKTAPTAKQDTTPAGSQMVMSMREHKELEKEDPIIQTDKTKKLKPAGEAQAISHQKTPPSWHADVFIGLTFVLSLVVIRLLGFEIHSLDWLGLGLFGLTVFLAEFISLDIYARETSISTSAAPLLAGVLMFGPIGALVVSFIMSITAWIKHRGQFSRIVFNFSNQLLATGIVLGIVRLLNGSYLEWNQAYQLLMNLLGAMVIYFITTTMVSIGIHLFRGTPTQEIWNRQFRWLAIYYLLFGAFAYTLGFGYITLGPIGIIFMITPLFLLRFSQKQYIDHTKEAVDKLRKKNLELQQRSDEIHQLNEDLLNSFAYLLDLRDPFVHGHSQQVAYYAVEIGKRFGLNSSRLENLRKAGILHDIGKMVISDSILMKPGKLTESEFEEVKNHVTLGANLIRQCSSINHLSPIVENHHEQYSGNGYPKGIKENEIPLEARILGLADSVEAMSSDRPYRKALNFREITAEIKRCRGTQFDPEVVDTFLELLEERGEEFLVNTAIGMNKKTGKFGGERALFKNTRTIDDDLYSVSKIVGQS
jgi:diguanylate cyclase (GGDEF)-like protein/putative nucleotidyltransferase with HDIG domain